MTARFAQAQKSDLPALTALWQTCFGDEKKQIEAFWRALRPHIRVFAAYEGKTPCAMLCARKNTQHRQTKQKVAATLRTRPTALRAGAGWRARQSLWTHSAAPCSAPQRMKFTPAPCHSPPMSMVSIRFT